jgi:hypothetical protein
MRIIQLEADAFKRLKAITIRPTTNIVEVTGDNGEGKSSTLDAIWAALGGKDACPAKPIHSGEERGEIRLILGDGGEPKFKVTRRFRQQEGENYTTDVIVETAEGAKFSKGQSILDQMVGEMCFDPMAFLALPDKDQISALREFVPGVDFAAIETLNKSDFNDRTEIGRKIRDLKGQLAAMPDDPDVPAPVDTAALESDLARAAHHNSGIAQRKANREAAEDRATGHAERAKELRNQAAALIAQAEAEEGLHKNLRNQIDSADPLPEPIDTDKVQQELAQGRRDNELRAAAEARAIVALKLKVQEAAEAALTATIEGRRQQMADAVFAAEMPIPGLGFGDGFVTLNGEPFAQASRAEQIRASVAIAASMNPQLRVARVMDGSLLDGKSWAALESYAAKHDLQIWVETVTQHSQAAIHIEDGGIAPSEAVATPTDAHSEVEEVGDVL